jgi:hypothetical protein
MLLREVGRQLARKAMQVSTQNRVLGNANLTRSKTLRFTGQIFVREFEQKEREGRKKRDAFS